MEYFKIVNKYKDEFIELARGMCEKNELKVIVKALNFAENAHRHQLRKSGEPYIIHPILTATKLINWKMDYETIAAGLLHDVIEDTTYTYDDLLVDFGFNIADIVQTVSKVTQYSKKQRGELQKHQLDNLYVVKVFLSLSKDLRAIVVKLADRLHNIETIQHLVLSKQISIAKETLEIYSSIAGRLGMHNIKTKLQDICFKIINPHEYSLIYKQVQKLENNSSSTWDRVRNQVNKMLDAEGINHKLEFRIKGIYSIWTKIEKGYLPENIHDIFAMRIIVDDELECYKVLGLVHLNFIYIKNAFKDFISSPKWNLYRSIHTTIITNNVLIEFQIRTKNMHSISQMGLAAHWKYKEGENATKLSKKLIDEFLQGREASIDVIKEISKADLFEILLSNDNEFYVCSNQTTILDLAFRYDVKKLEYLSGLFKNGEKVTLDSRVNKGDVVQFIYSQTTKIAKNWIQSTQNINVINHINSIFEKRNTLIQHNIDTFLEEVQKYLNISEISTKMYHKRLSYIGYKDLNTFLEDIAKTKITREELFGFFSKEEEIWKKSFKIIKKLLSYKIFIDTYFLPPSGIVPDKLVITECCSKFPKVPLIGMLKNNVLKVHRYDCPKANINQGKRVVVEWDDQALLDKPKLFKVKLKIFGKITETVANQIIQTMLQHKSLILKVDIEKNLDDVNFKGNSVIRISDDNQLKRLIANLKLQGFVKEVEIV